MRCFKFPIDGGLLQEINYTCFSNGFDDIASQSSLDTL
jgi:hypothetical protein